MNHFPIFLATSGQRIVLAGGGEAALAKLRLLLKTEAQIDVYAPAPAPEIADWAMEGRLTLHTRPFAVGDAQGAIIAYAASENAGEDARIAGIARAEGTLVNLVDNLLDSAFITPAIVDRDPVTIAIGTEGAAPVLARAIKAELEQKLSPDLGTLARIGKRFRKQAEALPIGRKRREFWADYYFHAGPEAMDARGPSGLWTTLKSLLSRHQASATDRGHIDLIGTGLGDAEMLSIKARKAIDEADVIAYTSEITTEILDLARREAQFINLDKSSEDLIALAHSGARIARLKSGAGTPDALIAEAAAADISWRILPGASLPAASSQDIQKLERVI